MKRYLITNVPYPEGIGWEGEGATLNSQFLDEGSLQKIDLDELLHWDHLEMLMRHAPVHQIREQDRAKVLALLASTLWMDKCGQMPRPGQEQYSEKIDLTPFLYPKPVELQIGNVRLFVRWALSNEASKFWPALAVGLTDTQDGL